MEENNNQKKLTNRAFVEGYLRENYLKEGTNEAGRKYISGDVVVSINRFNSQRVRVYAYATTKEGKESKSYKSLKTLLSDKAVTIASYVANLPQDGIDLETLDENVWDAASKVAAKVWFIGSIEEYATISVDEKGNEKETSSFSFRAISGSIRDEKENKPFAPRDIVELDGAILNIRDEQKRNANDDMEETGRAIVDYLYIDYKGIGHKFRLYAGSEKINPSDKNSSTFAEYVKDNYEADQTAKFTIAIVNLAEKKVLEPKEASWGVTSEPKVVTNFAHELRIIGGRSMAGLNEGDDGAVTKEEITDASVKRRVAAKENYDRYQAKKKNGTTPKAAQPAKGFGQTAIDQPTSSGPGNFIVPDFNDF